MLRLELEFVTLDSRNPVPIVIEIRMRAVRLCVEHPLEAHVDASLVLSKRQSCVVEHPTVQVRRVEPLLVATLAV